MDSNSQSPSAQVPDSATAEQPATDRPAIAQPAAQHASAETASAKHSEAEELPAKRGTWAAKFAAAWQGVVLGVRTERSFRVHLPMAIAVVACAAFFQLSLERWCLVILAIAVVLAAELMNSAIEALAHHVEKKQHPTIGRGAGYGQWRGIGDVAWERRSWEQSSFSPRCSRRSDEKRRVYFFSAYSSLADSPADSAFHSSTVS